MKCNYKYNIDTDVCKNCGISEYCKSSEKVEPIKEVCEIKQLTIEELQNNFELDNCMENLEKDYLGLYTQVLIKYKWYGYLQAHKSLGIIKE